MARGSVVDESRMITAKIPETPHQGYLDYEQPQKKIHRLPSCSQKCIEYRKNSETTSSQLGRR